MFGRRKRQLQKSQELIDKKNQLLQEKRAQLGPLETELEQINEVLIAIERARRMLRENFHKDPKKTAIEVKEKLAHACVLSQKCERRHHRDHSNHVWHKIRLAEEALERIMHEDGPNPPRNVMKDYDDRLFSIEHRVRTEYTEIQSEKQAVHNEIRSLR